MIAPDQLASYLDALLGASGYDEGEPTNGLLLNAGRPVTKLAVAVNTSFEAIAQASARGAELLIVHHPTWKSIDHALKPRKETELLAAGVSLYGAHASLDCHPDFGSSDTLARALDIVVDGRFAPYCGGLVGVHGRWKGTLEAFEARVRAELAAPVQAWQNATAFGHIGLVTGGGGWTTWVEEARLLGCDTYLTGEVSMYTSLFARESGLNLLAATHYATERHGVKSLAAHVGEHFHLTWTFIEEQRDIP